ncbi:MAG: maltose alpha-D-glucosyltransferase [Planctomycetales bacterium]|nr:maltose alpha-D-glucosyltransferase [Planctomycetales bacterium]
MTTAAPPPPRHQDHVLYEVYVRGFHDGNGDGIGDLAGLTQKLGYIRDLGVGAIWILPHYPSPLRDDGYDISDFRGVHPDLGSLDDFARLLDRSHALGLRVFTDLVVNHTSADHPWFQSARLGPGRPHHDWYVWSPAPDRYRGVRVIFSDTETSNWTLDPACGLYYWHRFYSHQPDLNYENPEVRAEMLSVARFWWDLGVDGFRVDAAPYLFEREGTSCESLPETHAFLRELRRAADSYETPRVLLAEANQRPDDLLPYFGSGDEFHMALHFPLMNALFLAVRREDSRPVLDVLRNSPALPRDCQWAMFLRNHDELTLEMLPPEERAYMLEQYGASRGSRLNLGIRRRLWPLMLGGRRQIELLHGLILSLPGAAVLYYGDEIGMGDDATLGDRMGVRTPMQWTTGKNAGFSDADPSRLYAPVVTGPEYHYAGVNVEAQDQKPTSFLNWLRRTLKSHRRTAAFRGPGIWPVDTGNPRVLAFTREAERSVVLCVNNLARSVQPALLDLSAWRGRVPVDAMGGARFPPVGSERYLVTLGPHSFYWLRLEEG